MDLSKIHILVLDSDPSSAREICNAMSRIGYQVSMASNESDAFVLAEQRLFNLVIKSFDTERVSSAGAIAFMEKIRAITPDTQFIFVSIGGTIQTAIGAIRRGAYDYLSKPIDLVQLADSIKKALDHQALVAEDHQLKLRLRRRSEPNIFAGMSLSMQEFCRLYGKELRIFYRLWNHSHSTFAPSTAAARKSLAERSSLFFGPCHGLAMFDSFAIL